MKDPIFLIEEAIEAQRYRMKGYEVASENTMFETLRALDFAYCRELFPELEKVERDELLEESIRRCGVNAALLRVMPRSMQGEQPKFFPSNKKIAGQADDFLFNAGTLELAERQLSMVHAGVLEAKIAPHEVMGLPLVILSVNDTTAYREQVGGQGRSWMSEQAVRIDRGWEQDIDERHRRILPLVTKFLRRHDIDEDFPVDDIDKHFQEYAVLYLRRMAFSDLLADDDRIGGGRYSEYVAVLVALSTLSAQRLCYAGILNADDPRIGIRNLLTGGETYAQLVEALACSLDATTGEIKILLDHLSLSPSNMETHLQKGTPAFAPVIRINEHFCILPSYGLEMNPFVFLFNELRERYSKEWFDLVNNRESRWVKDLLSLFARPSWSCRGGVELKRSGKLLTDIDFVAYDRGTHTLLLFQLKWQQAPVGDQRVRRSNANNLVNACNKWVQDIHDWINREGVESITTRCGLKDCNVASFHTIVLGRYDANFTGRADLDERAVWSDWGNFLRLYHQMPNGSAGEFVDELRAMMEKAASEVRPETMYLLLPGLGLAVNPELRA